MKRLIPCLIIVALVIVGCAVGYNTSKKECNKTDTELKNCETAFINEDYETAKKIAEKIIKDWENREEKLAVFVNHTFLDEITENLCEIPHYANTKDKNYGLSKISATRKILKHITEHQSLVTENFY